MAISLARTRRSSRVEYDRFVDIGVFKPGERPELVDGLLVVREPQGSAHVMGVRMAEEALRSAFGPPGGRAHPLALDDASEISEPSLAFDLQDKDSLYARAALYPRSLRVSAVLGGWWVSAPSDGDREGAHWSRW